MSPDSGEMPERSNGAVSKTVVGVTPPRVRIPVSPPEIKHLRERPGIVPASFLPAICMRANFGVGRRPR